MAKKDFKIDSISLEIEIKTIYLTLIRCGPNKVENV